jgi:hypothetical protein
VARSAHTQAQNSENRAAQACCVRQTQTPDSAALHPGSEYVVIPAKAGIQGFINDRPILVANGRSATPRPSVPPPSAPARRTIPPPLPPTPTQSFPDRRALIPLRRSRPPTPGPAPCARFRAPGWLLRGGEPWFGPLLFRSSKTTCKVIGI